LQKLKHYHTDVSNYYVHSGIWQNCQKFPSKLSFSQYAGVMDRIMPYTCAF